MQDRALGLPLVVSVTDRGGAARGGRAAVVDRGPGPGGHDRGAVRQPRSALPDDLFSCVDVFTQQLNSSKDFVECEDVEFSHGAP